MKTKGGAVRGWHGPAVLRSEDLRKIPRKTSLISRVSWAVWLVKAEPASGAEFAGAAAGAAEPAVVAGPTNLIVGTPPGPRHPLRQTLLAAANRHHTCRTRRPPGSGRSSCSSARNRRPAPGRGGRSAPYS